MSRDYNLFGEPLPHNLGKPGRNDHVPTAENVSRVRQLVMANWTTAAIAHELGISRPTLRKHYLPDIEKARVAALGEMRAKMVIRLEQAADKGNVAAMKELLRMVREGELANGIGERPPSEEPAKEPKTERLGKKDQAQQDAQTAHVATGWNDLLRVH